MSMRWVGVLAFALAGCTASNPDDRASDFKVDYRQGVNTMDVEPGATGEHTAWCPNDMWTVSGGFAIPQNAQSFAVTSSMPVGGKWKVTVRNTTATKQRLNLVVYVGCVKP